ncbi:hypothetical protein IGI04_019511 [Brassica rapa subsp. trilocularis]|uniref:Uncharacterized protein n=1 Tax=Brassica rapa subsp. trilocularis TaxID=1813537 RepID=A0ABQ7MG17_BRACM|nr:hypothetical protein IGI04_019511 [Brassica rapa subsp. trilocularis]
MLGEKTRELVLVVSLQEKSCDHASHCSAADVPEIDSEAVPMGPLRQLRSCFFDDGPRSEIQKGDLADIWRKGGLPGRYPSLITEVSSYFGFCPSQLTPLTWRTLMAVPVLGEFHGFSVGVHEILYSYYFAHVVNKAGFYHL